MAIASGGTLGTGASSTAGTSFTLTTATNSLAAGDFAILTVASDNVATVDGSSNNHTSVTGGTGKWRKIYEQTNTVGGAAGDGVTVSMWVFEATGTNNTGTVFTINHSSTTDRAAEMWKFTKATGKSVMIDTAPASNPITNNTDASTGFGSVAFSGLASAARLYFRSLGKEANIGTTGFTASTNFTSAGQIRSRNNTSAVGACAEFRINTSTGETSNPTLAVTGDTAGIFESFIEGSVDLSVTEASDTISAAATLEVGAQASPTDAVDAIASAATLAIVAALTQTEEADALTAAATIPLLAAFAQTEAADTISADGTIAAAGLTADLSQTESADTPSSAATNEIAATLTQTEATDAISSAATLAIAAAFSQAETADAASSAAANAIAAAASATEAADTASAAAANAISAALTQSEALDSTSSAATLTIAAALSQSEASDAASAGASIASTAQAANDEAADSSSSASSLAISAVLSQSEAGDTIGAAAALAIVGALAQDEALDSIASDGIVGSAPLTADLSQSEADDALASAAALALVAVAANNDSSDALSADASLALAAALSSAEAADAVSSAAAISTKAHVASSPVYAQIEAGTGWRVATDRALDFSGAKFRIETRVRCEALHPETYQYQGLSELRWMFLLYPSLGTGTSLSLHNGSGPMALSQTMEGLGFAEGSDVWLAAEFDPADASVKFYLALDASNDYPASWTEVPLAWSTLAMDSFPAYSNYLFAGTRADQWPLQGRMYKQRVLVGGELFAEFDPQRDFVSGTHFDSAAPQHEGWDVYTGATLRADGLPEADDALASDVNTGAERSAALSVVEADDGISARAAHQSTQLEQPPIGAGGKATQRRRRIGSVAPRVADVIQFPPIASHVGVIEDGDTIQAEADITGLTIQDRQRRQRTAALLLAA